MSKKEKLIKRIKSRPIDLSFNELVTLLGFFGYYITKGRKTGGSRVSFTDGKGDYLRIHKPHPSNILKLYQIDLIFEELKGRKMI